MKKIRLGDHRGMYSSFLDVGVKTLGLSWTLSCLVLVVGRFNSGSLCG